VTGLAPWDFESPFPGSLTSTFLAQVWKKRRPVIQPGFHAAWLNRMTQTFNECAQIMVPAYPPVYLYAYLHIY